MEIGTFTLDTGEEVFGDGVVVRVAFTGHALSDAVAVKGLSKGMGRILYASV